LHDEKDAFLISGDISAMKRPRLKKIQTEIICPACQGTGFPPVAQPTQPGRKLYPAPCEKCLGKGRIGPAALSEEPVRGASHHDQGHDQDHDQDITFGMAGDELGFAEPLPRNR